MHSITLRRFRATTFALETITVTYSECVFVPLGTQHAMSMCYIVIYGLPGSTVLFHITSQTARFSKERKKK